MPVGGHGQCTFDRGFLVRGYCRPRQLYTSIRCEPALQRPMGFESARAVTPPSGPRIRWASGVWRGKQVALRYLAPSLIPQRSLLRFRSTAFLPESRLSSSNPHAPINGQECAIVTKPNGSYRNGSRRRHTAITYAHAPRATRPKSRGPCEAGPRYDLDAHMRL